MKHLSTLFIALLILITFPTKTYACMGFGCQTDLAILGEVTAVEGDTATVKPFHVFPNSEMAGVEILPVVGGNHPLEVGKKYALALRYEDQKYYPVWDALEIEGDSYQNAKLVQLKSGDDASTQWWINSNGEGPEFSFYQIGNRLFLRIGDAEGPFAQDLQVYPKPLTNWQFGGMVLAGFVLGLGLGYAMFARKKK